MVPSIYISGLMIILSCGCPPPHSRGHVFFFQLAEHDPVWLDSWAAALVHASKLDHSERSSWSESEEKTQSTDGIFDPKTTRPTTPETTGSRHPDPLGPPNPLYTGMQQPPPQGGNPSAMGNGGFASDGNAQRAGGRGQGGSVQGLREAMKADIRQRYAFSGTAKLWAREISGRSQQRAPGTRR